MGSRQSRTVGLTSNHPSAQGWSSRPRRATAGECQFAQFRDAILHSLSGEVPTHHSFRVARDTTSDSERPHGFASYR
jgi:hypothetical protein